MVRKFDYWFDQKAGLLFSTDNDGRKLELPSQEDFFERAAFLNANPDFIQVDMAAIIQADMGKAPNKSAGGMEFRVLKVNIASESGRLTYLYKDSDHNNILDEHDEAGFKITHDADPYTSKSFKYNFESKEFVCIN